jgi:exo-1,4-beta-D-glucosaminidase
MFEAFAGNKYKSSGIIYWMYNSAWPKLYWQFYDYFFTPNGSLYGARKACEKLHIQYSYDDGSVRIVNGFFEDFSKLKVTAKVYSYEMELKYSKEIVTDVKSDESRKLILEGWPKELTGVYFLKLLLTDEKGKEISSNFYWLSDKGDEKADFTALNNLPEVRLKYSISQLKTRKGKGSMVLKLENPSKNLAFSVNPKIIKKSSKELVSPVFWDDNYFSMLPGEKRKVRVEFFTGDLNGEAPVVLIEGWNIVPAEF